MYFVLNCNLRFILNSGKAHAPQVLGYCVLILCISFNRFLIGINLST
jgi:hypothetical protein